MTRLASPTFKFDELHNLDTLYMTSKLQSKI
uniref:Uncharacterized protein n=1 Tax=Arundo donax TaxID=35708 RepID=A0A0A9SN19_ARUDO